jgi:glycosyltransferase involved in cell wall biosynthesis
MRVAFISHYSDLYGANRSLLELISGLRGLGVQPYVVVPQKGGMTDKMDEMQIEYTVLPFRNWMQVVPEEKSVVRRVRQYLYVKRQAVKRLFANLLVFPELVGQLRRWDVDLVYTNSSVVPIGWFAARYLKKPHVLHIREFGYDDYFMRYDWGAYLSNTVIRASDARIAISKSIYAHYFSPADPKASVVYNGIMPAAKFIHLRDGAKNGKAKDAPFIFLMVGLIHPNKGQTQALEALSLVVKKHKNVKLLIAGNGDKAPLEAIIREKRLMGHVEFLGFVPDPTGLYQSADCLLVCSKCEGMGRATVEAMAACCPVIGYDAAGTAELVTHEVTGLLYKTNHLELALRMVRMLENPDLRQKLARNAWQEALAKYTTEQYAQNVYRVIEPLLNEAGTEYPRQQLN